MAKEGTQGQSLHHSAEAQCNMGLRKFTWINYYFIIFSILALECYFLNLVCMLPTRHRSHLDVFAHSCVVTDKYLRMSLP